MEAAAAWVAPIATMIAAMMTAANLGARITGWGFVIFTVGSVGWSIVAISSGQQNLLLTNGFLTLVNLVGIWRWLGRQARYEDGGATATRRSAATRVPTLYALGSFAGSRLIGKDGTAIGVIVEAMLRCSDAGIAYVVVSEGGIGGVGERLHALHPDELQLSEDGVACTLSASDLERRPILSPGAWPAAFTPEMRTTERTHASGFAAA
ncbi:PRC-barrel domain containing protein [Sphingomonas sp. AOB5]|uniref:PRC-barrel domain containing protein n=1 Tax=Sphingomonas sp. AOB5 TaxID=3034017 RepID=UPI0023F7053F|nr:PRC-barrel domain containing protein [Sphingomonas sp. AOB5]MDF7773655.1 PRC-barrel domain containing protein [Sphingomonas sp. AOB5]